VALSAMAGVDLLWAAYLTGTHAN